MVAPLSGRTAFVTGGARGIGRAVAVRLAELGADVAVATRDLLGGEIYVAEPPGIVTDDIVRLGRRTLGIEVDLTDEAQAHAAVDQVVTAWGGLDILVNVVGGAVTPFAESQPTATPTSDIRRLLDLNFLTAVHCCQAAAPALRASSSGAIVNVTSTAAFSVFDQGFISAYAASKAALTHWTRHLAAELGPAGVRVNMLAPGITLTGRIIAESAQTGLADRGSEVPLGRLGEPGDCADGVAFLVGDESRFITGSCLPVDGGWIPSPC